MNFKTIYLITIILMVSGVFFLIFKDPLIYLFYGYDPSIIGKYTAESSLANQKTFFLKRLSYYIVTGITILCFVFSCIAIYRKIFLSYYLTEISFIISLLLSLFYLFGLIILGIMPKRVV